MEKKQTENGFVPMQQWQINIMGLSRYIYIYIQRIYLHRHKRCSHSHLRVILPRSPTCVATFKHGLRHGYGCTDFFCEKDSSLEELRTPHPQPTPEYKDHLHTNIQSQRLYLET